MGPTRELARSLAARLTAGEVGGPPVSALGCLRRLDPRPVVVLEEEFDRRVHGAVSLREGRWLILLNAADPPELGRFSLAHEVAHIALGDVGASADLLAVGTERARHERACDAFAAELLMPAGLVRAAWRGERDAGRLSRAFEVPRRAMERRLGELGLG